ncbi:MAG: hypothetical protein LBP75_05885 [Planctomycetota bacterium]|nr:hypothetical protein [Planctomycetota bacterium]
MATKKTVKIKPVGVSEIKDLKIIREAIAQVHRRPTAEDWAYVKAREDALERAMAK